MRSLLFLIGLIVATGLQASDLRLIGVLGDIVIVQDNSRTYHVRINQEIGETGLSIVKIDTSTSYRSIVTLSNGLVIDPHTPPYEGKQPLMGDSLSVDEIQNSSAIRIYDDNGDEDGILLIRMLYCDKDLSCAEEVLCEDRLIPEMWIKKMKGKTSDNK